jgi:hypothetical protein
MANTISKCDDIESLIFKIRLSVECLEQPSSFDALTVKERRRLKEHKSSLFTLANRLEDLLEETFKEGK